MSNTDRVLIGKIVAAQGLRGQVRVQSYTDQPDELFNYGEIRDQNNNVVSIKFDRVASRDVVIASVSGTTDRNGAELLRGRELYINRDQLPKIDDDEFYVYDLIGMPVITDQKLNLGHVITVHNFGASDILEVGTSERDSVMIAFPMANVDMNNKIITVPHDAI